MASPTSPPSKPDTKQKQLLSSILPPLIFGTATLNYQFNVDPYALNPNNLVSQALHSGIRAFDTSPYYGPAEEILGAALHSPLVTQSPTLNLKRTDYFLLTKAGRIANNEFDYSPAWIRHSIKRSLRRLRTAYLDVVYLHDVEFVSPTEVLTAITELRRLRDEENLLHYIGIAGYPVQTLCSLATLIQTTTNEPIDIVQSYANYTIQNQLLLTQGLHHLLSTGVDVITNASPLGMGLLRQQGPPIGAMGNWHPAPTGLRAACAKAASWTQETQSERLESIAVSFALDSWLREGAQAGSCGPLPSDLTTDTTTSTPKRKRGVSVIGVSTLSELTETLKIYNTITTNDPSNLQQMQRLQHLAKTIREDIVGREWTDFAWESPEAGFVNQRKVFGVSEDERRQGEGERT